MDIKGLKVSELQDELKNRGLDISGSHSDLILRLQTALDEEEFGIDGHGDEVPTQPAPPGEVIDENQDEELIDEEPIAEIENGEEPEEQHNQIQEQKDPGEGQENQTQRKIRNSAARRAASAAKLIMSYDNPIGTSPSDLEYVSLKKDRGTRNVRAVTKEPTNNNASRVGRLIVPAQLARHLKSAPPPAPIAVNPEDEEKKRNRAERFGLPIALPPAVPPEAESHIQSKTRGKKRSTGGIIAAESNTEDDDKRRARELRFQASGLGTTDAVLQDLQEKKKRRIEKFASLRSEDISNTGGVSLSEINQQEAREARFSFAIDRDLSEEQQHIESLPDLNNEAKGVSSSP